MSDLWTIVILMVAGLTMIGLEVYVPGGILGFIGTVLLIFAAGFSYRTYAWGGVASVALIEAVLAGVVLVVAMKYFPDTKAGKKMILSTTQAGQRAQTARATELVGKTGKAHTILRPGGVAVIDGKRLDVVAESGMIERGSAIAVVALVENQIVVRKT